MRYLRVAFFGVMTGVLVVSSFAAGVSQTAAASSPPVLALYYAWYDQNSWDPGRLSDLPAPRYVSADRATIERHVRQAQSAGIDAFALNWFGPWNPTDGNLQTLLSVAGGVGFQVTVDFDMNSPFIHNAGDVINYLRHATRYFGDGAWFRYDGKPVVFFYGTRKYDVGTWASIRSQVDPNRQAVWIGEGDIFSYLDVFDGIHPYSIAWSPDPARQLASYAAKTRAKGAGKLWVATVMPGYDDTRLGRGTAGYARDRQGGGFYRATWEGAIATQPAMISITSWNEWLEGSQIEPSVSYGDLYLRLTREYSDRYKSGPRASASQSANHPLRLGPFYVEAGQGRGGYAISDDGGVGFWSSFQALGGVDALGYPSSQRFELADGFTYQAIQGALLQWRPELGRAVLANTFEMLQAAGKDDWLDQAKGIPRPVSDDGSGGNWWRAREIRLSWLTSDAIRAKYLSTGSVDRAVELYGLPMSGPEQRGPFIVQRFQRIAFQHWIQSVPGMPAPGSVVRVLGGDLLKEAGLIPAAAAEPTR